MHHYQYQYGDTPLEGYTIQRAAGYGGFGEVYYALSDSGRQVALKTVQNYEQIELRGIKQCMNLKNPHLVTIFDVKYNDQGRPFVIMEYVSGVSLRDLLNESPGGLGTQKAAFFVREIAKGLSYLHECGIVHRDLKPSNIFFENGLVKIGDYGLTKAITAGQHSAQTITVGTVHYMAPEVGEGRYDFSIDIYALGVLLYEMLTGQVPFFGASPGEVLMKHMSSDPDLAGIEEPFARVIKKALAKDPSLRYQTVQEMVEDIFGTEHIRNSVSQFSPESLSMVAQRVAQKAKPAPDTRKTPGRDSDLTRLGEQIGRKLGAAGDRLAQKIGQATQRLEQGGIPLPQVDPVERSQRVVLALTTLFIMSCGVGVFSSSKAGVTAMLMMAGMSVGILLARWRLFTQLEPGGLRNFLTAGMGLLIGGLLSSGFMASRFNQYVAGTYLTLGIICLGDWWKDTAPNRKERIDWGGIVFGSFITFLLAGLFHGHQAICVGVIAGTSIIVQICSPFTGPGTAAAVAATKGAKNKQSVFKQFHEKFIIPGHTPAPGQPAVGPYGTSTGPARHLVPPWLRALFLVGSLLLIGLGLVALISSGVISWDHEEFAGMVSLGVAGILGALFCLSRGCRSTYVSWYRYIIKPALLLACLLTTITASIFLGNVPVDNEEQVLMIFLIVFPAILFFFIVLIPNHLIESAIHPSINDSRISTWVSPQKRLWALLFALPMPFPAGLHRIYVGKIGTGIVWFFTGGLFFIGQAIDIILILAGRFTDAEGRPLLYWTEGDRQATQQQDSHKQSPFPAPAQQQVPVRKKPVPDPKEMQDPGLGYHASTDTSSPPGSSALLTAYERINPIGTFLSIVGYLLVIAAVLIGIIGALRLSWLIEAGVPDPHIAEDIRDFFGYALWPQLVNKIVFIASIILCFGAAVLVAVGRRKAGSGHVLRGVIGIGGLLVAVIILGNLLPEYYFSDMYVTGMWRDGQIGPALEHLFDHCRNSTWTCFLVLSLVSVIILAWPPKRPQPQSSDVPQEDNKGVN